MAFKRPAGLDLLRHIDTDRPDPGDFSLLVKDRELGHVDRMHATVEESAGDLSVLDFAVLQDRQFLPFAMSGILRRLILFDKNPL